MTGAEVPSLRLNVVDITEDDEGPGEDDTSPTGEAMMTFKDTEQITLQ